MSKAYGEFRLILQNQGYQLDIKTIDTLYKYLQDYREWLGGIQWDGWVLEGKTGYGYSQEFQDLIEDELQKTELVLLEGVRL